MRVVVVGGGKVGGYVSRQLAEGGHAVAVIEQVARRANDLAEGGLGLVIHGDGTNVDTLRSARVEQADWLLAVTGQDEVNLVACELGSTLGAGRTLARLNEPRNRATFAALGILVVAVTDLIGEVIERELDDRQLDRLTILGGGSLSLVEVTVPDGVAPRRVDEIRLPGESILVAVRSEATTSIPGPGTVIRPGDRVVAVTTLDGEAAVRDSLSTA
jgi:trk system potassium uptake protein